MSSAAKAKNWSALHQLLASSPCSTHIRFLGSSSTSRTHFQTNNTMALGIVNNNIMKRLKAMDMKYHWLQDRISQKKIRHYWAPGSKNKGGYVTKNHPRFTMRLCSRLSSPALPLCKHSVKGSQISFLQQGCARHIHRGIIMVPTVSILCYTYLQDAWQTDGQRHNTIQSSCVTEM
jgi:hypothetical protein